MDSMEKFRQQETMNVVKWAINNLDLWRSMFDQSTIEASPNDMLNYIEELEKQSFYYLIPVLWTMGSNHLVIDRAITTFLFNKIFELWENMDIKEINNEIKEMVKKTLNERL